LELTGEKKVTFGFASLNLSTPRKSSLEVRYTGSLNNQMAGFYRSKYIDRHGQSQFMASTQFESLDERRAFSCVDEPATKATFIV
jgi:aminopeptidase 2